MDDAEIPDREGAPGLDLGAPSPSAGGSYRVLARKYRPATFDDLIGQDAMVRTLSNAFESGRIPQAWILTGVRGVGKTTTARILARGLNYQRADGSGGPTVHMPELGVHCASIMESRHVDVIEMDAASHNGVDDVRQINDAVRYAPAIARYKVYILDEVHMLSTAAFNALLKTLEEPPPHVKFVFATTEIRKVPITILSRCQRFDLRRVDAGLLVQHLQTICGKEGVTAEPEALALIARAAEGSVRDSLSLLDQAIAHAAGPVRAEDVRQMLGLADRARVIDLFEALMRGDVAKALGELRDQYDSGADPAVVLTDLAEFTHFVTRVKVVPSVADDPSLAEVERTRGRAFAAALSMRVLSRTWQMLFKGLSEAQTAAKPIAAAEMVLVRIAYAADLPTPDEVVRTLVPGGAPAGNGGASVAANPAPAPSPVAAAPQPGPRMAYRGSDTAAARQPVVGRAAAAPQEAAVGTPVASFTALVDLAAARRDIQMQRALDADVRLVRFEDGKLEIALEPGASPLLVNELSRKLTEWTGRRWMVVVSTEPGEPTLKAQRDAAAKQMIEGVAAQPVVRAVLDRFPGAQIVAVRRREDDIPPAAAPMADEEGNAVEADDASAFGMRGAPDDVDDDF